MNNFFLIHEIYNKRCGYFSGDKIFVDAVIRGKNFVVGSGLNHTLRARLELWPLVSK